VAEHSYAEEVCQGLTGGNADLLRQAFAAVRKEDFLFAPPWTVMATRPGRSGRTMETSDVRDLYQDALIALLPRENINTGQPSMWAQVFHWSEVQAGMTVFQSGAGLGYFTAILAHVAGPQGRVFYQEPHALLKKKCADNLAQFRNVTSDFHGEALDRVYFYYGTTTLSAALFESLVVDGRAIVPLTDHEGRGRFVSMTKSPQGMLAEAGSPCTFIKSKDYKPSPGFEEIKNLEKIMVDRNSLGSATENGEIDLVRAIILAMERQ
jgi:protein-L-isoaspartate O-methyltransferase